MKSPRMSSLAFRQRQRLPRLQQVKIALAQRLATNRADRECRVALVADRVRKAAASKQGSRNDLALQFLGKSAAGVVRRRQDEVGFGILL